MRKLKAFVFLVVLGVVLVSFPTLSVAVEDVKIGVMLPLTGPPAKLGESSKNAFEFAAAEVNSEGGIKSLGGAKLKIIYGDTQGKPEVAVTIAQQLIQKDNVVLITGAWQ